MEKYFGSKGSLFACLFFTFLFFSIELKAQTAADTSSSTKDFKGKGTMITLSDYGADDYAYLVLPDLPPVGGIIIVHDQWGLDSVTKQRADLFAKIGYVALAVDLYNNRTASDLNLAKEIAQQVHFPSATKTVQAGILMLKENPRFKVNKVALIGWNWGGDACVEMLGDLSDINAAAIIDSSEVPDHKKLEKIRFPVCVVEPNQTGPDTATDAEALSKEKSKQIEVHLLETSAGFADPNQPSLYHADQAKQAEEFVAAFFADKIILPAPKQSLIKRAEKIF